MLSNLKFIIFAYAFVLALVFFGQRQLQYHPDKNIVGGTLGHNVAEMREITVRTQDGLLLFGWYAPPKKGKPVVVLFHGNAGHIGGRAFKARAFMDAGYGVLLAEYRGYGGNPGNPDEKGFYNDARAFIDWLGKAERIPEKGIVLYGESIGSGVAVQMAVEHGGVAGLVLEAPFSSALDVAKGVYWWLPVGYLMIDKFMSIEKIGFIHAPLLIMHGDNDKTVPFSLGQKLFDAANNPKTFVAIKGGGHSDLYDFGAAKIVTGFLEKVSPETKTAPPVSP